VPAVAFVSSHFAGYAARGGAAAHDPDGRCHCDVGRGAAPGLLRRSARARCDWDLD